MSSEGPCSLISGAGDFFDGKPDLLNNVDRDIRPIIQITIRNDTIRLVLLARDSVVIPLVIRATSSGSSVAACEAVRRTRPSGDGEANSHRSFDSLAPARLAPRYTQGCTPCSLSRPFPRPCIALPHTQNSFVAIVSFLPVIGISPPFQSVSGPHFPTPSRNHRNYAHL